MFKLSEHSETFRQTNTIKMFKVSKNQNAEDMTYQQIPECKKMEHAENMSTKFQGAKTIWNMQKKNATICGKHLA